MQVRDWILVWSFAASFLASADSALRAQQPKFDTTRWWSTLFGGSISNAVLANGFGDLHLDGALETVSSHGPNFPVPGFSFVVGLNDGSGHYAGQSLVPTPPGVPALISRGVSLGDLNCDGYLDLLVRGAGVVPPAPNRLYAFLGDGHGNLTPSTAVTFHPDPIWSWTDLSDHLVRVGDLNGDGCDDVMTTYPDLSVAVYLNDGAGHFHEYVGAVTDPQAGGARALLADLDRDTDLDLVTSYGSIFWNRGDGSFVPGPRVRGGGYSVGAGDVDGDGWADLAFGANSTQPILFLNDRIGGFVDESWRITPVSATAVFQRNWVQIVDVDGDGRMDINYHGTSSSVPWKSELYLQDATGHFADGATRVGQSAIPAGGAKVYFDMDRDGDLDLLAFIPGQAGWRVYPNLQRQIMTNDPPIGGSLDVDVFAPVGHFVTFALSLGRMDALVPSFGWWGLDPTSTAFWPSSTQVPASGTVRFSMPVPNQPSLRGLRLFAQGVDVDVLASDVRLMNFWPITIQ